MDFIDSLKQLSDRASNLKSAITTEESTKTSLVMPFFQLLGYDVFDASEFVPEYTADVGIKKGEKVDYAILKDGEPVILIECKWCGESLDKHSSQLFRYFGTSSARFGILTNGIQYNFYTDLDEANKMDLVPFLTFDLFDIKPATVSELKKFHKEYFNVDNIFSTASELKYSKAIKDYIAEQLKEPSDSFVKFFLSAVYDGVKTQHIIDKYRDIVKKSLNDYISEIMNDKITAALQSDSSKDESLPTIEEDSVDGGEDSTNKIITTAEELESYYIIKSLFNGILELSRITYKDTESYFAITLDNNIKKPICRINLDTRKKQILIPDESKKYNRIYVDSINDFYNFKDELISVVNRYLN